MKICVTGGAGFIASHLADKFIELGHEVVIIDNLSTGLAENINPAARFIRCDINDKTIYGLFSKEKFDILSHHAAQMDVRLSVRDPKYDAMNNIIGSLNLYEAAKETGVKKIIFASSGGTIYGEQEYFPADENHPTNPCSPYGISKLVNEKYLYYYQQVYGIPFISFRYGNVYGSRQNPHGEAGVVAIFTERMICGNQPVINGDGLITRDYIYIDDVVKANILALEDNVSGIFNVTTAKEHDVNYIFKKLKELTHSKCSEVHGEAKAGEQRRACCSYEKFNRMHGWSPETSFEEGLKKTVDYFRMKLKT